MRLILTLIVLISEFSGLWAKSSDCPLKKDKVKKEADYFIVQYNDIDETIKSFNKLKDEADELDLHHFAENVDQVVAELEHLKVISSKSFIDVENVNVYCENMIHMRDGLRKMNYFREKHLLPITITYKDLLDCFRSEDRINCRFALERIYLSPDVVIAADQAADVDILKVNHSDLVELYHESNRHFADVSLMIIWFRTFRLIDVDSSETDVADFEPVESELPNVESQINDAYKTMQYISTNIGNANSSKAVDETSKMLADINSSLFQLREVKEFLTTCNTSLSTLQENIKKRRSSKMSLSTELYFEYAYEGELTLRELISSFQIEANKDIKNREANSSKIERVMRRAGNRLSKQSNRFMSFEIITNSMIEHNANVVSFHQCFKEVFDAIRPLARSRNIIERLKYFVTVLYAFKAWSKVPRFKTVDSDLDTLTIRYLLVYRKYFVVWLKEQSARQKLYVDRLDKYLKELKTNASAENPFTASTTKTEQQRNKVTRYLRLFHAAEARLMKNQCDLSKAIVNAIWIKYLETLGGPFETMYDNDDVVQTLLNEQNESSLSSFLTSKIEPWMEKLLHINDGLRHEIHNHKTYGKQKKFEAGYRFAEMDFSLGRFHYNENLLSEAGVASTEFLSEVAHAARIGMQTSLFHFEETFFEHVDEGEDENEAVRLGEINSNIENNSDPIPRITGLLSANSELLERVDDDSISQGIVDQYTEQVPTNVYTFGDNKYLFEYEPCGHHCVIEVQLTDLVDAEFAVIFGTILQNDRGLYRAIMHYTQTVGPITLDKKEILARFNDFNNEIDFYYLDKYNTAQEPLHVELTDRQPLSLFIAVAGSASFTFQRVDVVILGPSLLGSDDDHERQRHPSYKHYQFNTSDEIETNYYAMRGSEPDFGDEEEYYSVPVNSEDVCTAIGLVYNHVGKFGKITQKGYYYNGRHVVNNPVYACHDHDYSRTDDDSATDGLNGDTATDGLNGDSARTLIMSFRYQTDEDSNLILEAKFFSSGANVYYSLLTTEKTKFVPAYIYQKLVSTDVETSFQIHKIDPPPELPGHVKHLCSHKSECSRDRTMKTRQKCRFQTTNDSNLNSEGPEWIFGQCRS